MRNATSLNLIRRIRPVCMSNTVTHQMYILKANGYWTPVGLPQTERNAKR